MSETRNSYSKETQYSPGTVRVQLDRMLKQFYILQRCLAMESDNTYMYLKCILFLHVLQRFDWL